MALALEGDLSVEPWGAEIEEMGSEWMEGEALEARSVDSPFDEFHGEVKKGERTCTEEGEENVLGHLECVFVCLFEILETCICL